MPALSLTDQLAQRAKTFATNTGLSQRKLARLLKIDESHFSKFLNGQTNLSAESTLALLRLTSMTKQQLELEFSNPERLTSRIMNLQEEGRPTEFNESHFIDRKHLDQKLGKRPESHFQHFYSGFQGEGGYWVAKEGGSDDPNDTTGIDNTPKMNGDPCGDDFLDTLRQVDNFHRLAREAIADYISQAQKAKVNKTGSTEGNRTVDSKSTKPGPRGDAFRVKDRASHLAFLEKERAKAEKELALEQAIQLQRKELLNAEMQLHQLKP
jgi:transcriptional regulator with XRE-family HTH domain